MKRIQTVLVLLTAILLVSASVSVPAVHAGDSYSIELPQAGLKSGDQEAGNESAPIDPEGDPDGLDDTNDGPSARAQGVEFEGAEWAKYLLFLLSQIQLLAL